MNRKWKRVFVNVAWLLALSAAVLPQQASAEIPRPNMDMYFPTDIKGHWAEPTLTGFVQAQILKGNGAGGRPQMKPNDTATRAEFLAILLRATGEKTSASTVTRFSDVGPSDWFAGTVSTAVSLGIIDGIGGGLFAPNAPIRRGEIAKLLVRYFDGRVSFEGPSRPFTDVKGHWAADYVTRLSKAEIVYGYGDSFGPDAVATRAEAVAMIDRALRKETLQVPSDEELTGVVLKDVEEGLELLKAAPLAALDNTSLANRDGFSRDASVLSLADVSASGVQNLEASINGVPVLKVTQKASRYAQVEISGASIALAYVTAGGMSVKKSVPLNDRYLLRKVDNRWKIYGAANEYGETKRRIGPVSLLSSAKLSFASVKDAFVSASQPVIYYLDASLNRLVRLNYQTGETQEAVLRHQGEKLALVPGTGDVVVAETIQPHSSYWWTQDQSGTVEVFDAKTLTLKVAMDVKTDPYDIAADSKGFVYISSGSGQWTNLSSYSLTTKSLVDSKQIRQQSRIVLSPGESKLYTVDSDSSPRDIAAYEIADGKFTASYDSPYHGDYAMGTINWLSPDGTLIMNSVGTVFQTAGGRSGDMRYLTALNASFEAFAAYDDLFFTAAEDTVRVYQADRLVEIGSFRAAGSILNMWTRDRELVLLVRVLPEGSNRPQNILQIVQL